MKLKSTLSPEYRISIIILMPIVLFMACPQSPFDFPLIYKNSCQPIEAHAEGSPLCPFGHGLITSFQTSDPKSKKNAAFPCQNTFAKMDLTITGNSPGKKLGELDAITGRFSKNENFQHSSFDC